MNKIKEEEVRDGVTLTIEDFIEDLEQVEAFGLCDDFEKEGKEFSGAIK